jgi:Flp pilus assembly protein TadD
MRILVLLTAATLVVFGADEGAGLPSLAGLSPSLRAQVEPALKARRLEDAETALVEAAGKEPANTQILKLLGAIFFLDGKYLNCSVALARADKVQPLDNRSRFLLAMAFNSLGRADWARPELEKLAKADPQNPEYGYWLARLDFATQNYTTAADKLAEVVRVSPDFVRAWEALALSNEALGRTAAAQKNFLEAVKRNREQKTPSPWPLVDFGTMLLKTGNATEAEVYLREALRYQPGFAQGHFRLGAALEQQGRDVEAIAAYQEAARLDANYAEPLAGLVKLYTRHGQRQDAEQASAELQARQSRSKPAPAMQ